MGVVEMKTYEIRKIGPGSVFKLYFTIGLVIGLIVSLVMVLVGISLKNIGFQLGTINMNHIGLLQIGAAILGVIIGSLVYGLVAGLAGMIGALIYNAFAALVGGIKVNLNERE
jgi:Transmembrane domain of unknown function (DUF3566)